MVSHLSTAIAASALNEPLELPDGVGGSQDQRVWHMIASNMAKAMTKTIKNHIRLTGQ
jgi:hypothetical protein